MVNIVETRYFKNANITNNGLTCKDLGTTQTGTFAIISQSAAGSKVVRWGIRVWKRTSGGSETEITSGTPVAQVSRGSDPPAPGGEQSNTWACPQTPLNLTDSIIVRLYMSLDLGTPSWVEKQTWQTEDLNQPYLKSATWTVVYFTNRYYDGVNTNGYFMYGSSSRNSRIENFTYGDLAVTTTRTISQNAGIKASGQTQTLSQNAAILAQSRTLDQNAHVKASGQTQTIQQNAHILASGQTQTIAQDAWIKLIVFSTRTIEQDARIKETSIQSLSQDARIIALGQTQTLLENAHIKAVGLTQTISQNATIQAVSQTLEQDACLKETVTQTLSQNAHLIAVGQTQTLQENAHIKASGQTQTIAQDAHVKVAGTTQTCSQDAWIKASGQIQVINQNASLWAAGQTALLIQNASIDPLTTDTWIDSFALPHVLTFRIVYDATIVDKKVQNGILPRRKMIGKRGRTAEITGWTRQQSDIDTMQGFENGTTKTFYHPTGGFQALVRDFQSSKSVDRWDRRIYQLTVVEQET